MLLTVPAGIVICHIWNVSCDICTQEEEKRRREEKREGRELIHAIHLITRTSCQSDENENIKKIHITVRPSS